LHGGSPKIIILITEKFCLHCRGYFWVKKKKERKKEKEKKRPAEVDSREIFVTASEVFLEQYKQHTVSLPLNLT
jgi:hypothetical protein